MESFLPRGVLAALPTPFVDNKVDYEGLGGAMEVAVECGVDGLVVFGAGSEVESLSEGEVSEVLKKLADLTPSVSILLGAVQPSVVADTPSSVPPSLDVSARLLRVPFGLHSQDVETIIGTLERLAQNLKGLIVLEDVQMDGPGLSVSTIVRLKKRIPSLAGVCLDTAAPATKYTALRTAIGKGHNFWIAAGPCSAVHMFEALDRSVDAVVTDCGTAFLVKNIDSRYFHGKRKTALSLFHQILPAFAYASQDNHRRARLAKRVLCQHGLINTVECRPPPDPAAEEDVVASRIEEELSDLLVEAKYQLSDAIDREAAKRAERSSDGVWSEGIQTALQSMLLQQLSGLPAASNQPENTNGNGAEYKNNTNDANVTNNCESKDVANEANCAPDDDVDDPD
eukprot:NODE_494_length_1607_cov_22.690629_g376_i0.p1 GENE.NODE_494_length_1607_cov_22.690629_g376_i0~~NODE_494_length_1607_cov_22.690629_g376_i0.p1  ORF type:complete len:397 (+),score=71.63 NODE_494_length_1607_cov_22.690629_g376_i0:146-1336(+)